MNLETVTVKELRWHGPGWYLARCRLLGTAYQVLSHGRPVAVLLPQGQFRLLKRRAERNTGGRLPARKGP